MKNIQAVKIGNTVNVSISGKLHKKNCGTVSEADELFRLVLKAKDDPTDENIKAFRAFLNEKTRVAMLAGLEHDPDTGEVYLAGFNTPIPTTLVDVIKEYHENDYPMEAIVNFWSLLMLNPDTRVRTVLFDFIKTHDFVLTDSGYMVVYKAVYQVKEEGVDTSFAEFVNRMFLKVKKDWGCGANKYVVYKKLDTGEFDITKKRTANKWDENEKNIEILGKLGELHDAIYNTQTDETDKAVPVYTDMHSRTMRIVLGEPVRQERKDCDADFRRDCSNGLHCGATRFVENFANRECEILICYVNPANVVAVPDYDHSKIRVCEYFPFALATYENGKIDAIEQSYFESDYVDYETEKLKYQIALVQANELPIEKAMNAEAEERPMSELLKIIESRLIDIK